MTAALAGSSFVGCPVAKKPNGASKKAKGGKKHHKRGKSHKKRDKSHKKGAAEIAAAKKPATVVRKLWGNAHGSFTTSGRYASASVLGTIWLTEDRCDGTYFEVTKDTLAVTAFAHPKKVHNVKQGQSILIPKP
jgi:hypothetical protein